MDAQGLTTQQLARMSGVAEVTIRDLCNGRRWPWTTKRNAIELALEWDTGRIAQIAKGNEDPDGVLNLAGMDVQTALSELLERSTLSPARRAKVLALYLELVEDQERAEHRRGERGEATY